MVSHIVPIDLLIDGGSRRQFISRWQPQFKRLGDVFRSIFWFEFNQQPSVMKEFNDRLSWRQFSGDSRCDMAVKAPEPK